MKKLIVFLLLSVFITSFEKDLYCQNYNQVQQNLNKLQKHFDDNKQQIKELRTWINDLRFKKIDDVLNNSLNTASAKLRKLENGDFYGGDLGAYDDLISEIRNYINLELENYNNRIRGNSNSNSNTTSNTNDSGRYFQNAIDEWGKKNINAALENINTYIQLNDNNSDAYEFRGYIYLFGFSNFDKAIQDFNKRLQMKKSSLSYMYRGMCFEAKEMFANAVQDYTQCILLDSENLDAYFRRGLSKSKLGDRNSAINDYDYIINYKGSFVFKTDELSTVYNNKAYCLIELNDLKGALPLVNKALELNNRQAFIWDTRGELNFKLSLFKNCIVDMSKAIDLDANASNSFYYRGLAKIKLNDKNGGCIDLSKAGELGKKEAYKAISDFCK